MYVHPSSELPILKLLEDSHIMKGSVGVQLIRNLHVFMVCVHQVQPVAGADVLLAQESRDRLELVPEFTG